MDGYHVEGAIYFSDRSNLKPMEIGTIKLKLTEFPNSLLHNVLHLLELWRNFLSLVHI
jgi:hypothetical protein